jgi:hypothetical protein
VDAGFLDFLAKQISTGKTPACRRAILRILAVVKANYEAGHYESDGEAENAFRRLVKGKKACK